MWSHSCSEAVSLRAVRLSLLKLSSCLFWSCQGVSLKAVKLYLLKLSSCLFWSCQAVSFEAVKLLLLKLSSHLHLGCQTVCFEAVKPSLLKLSKLFPLRLSSYLYYSYQAISIAAVLLHLLWLPAVNTEGCPAVLIVAVLSVYIEGRRSVCILAVKLFLLRLFVCFNRGWSDIQACLQSVTDVEESSNADWSKRCQDQVSIS